MKSIFQPVLLTARYWLRPGRRRPGGQGARMFDGGYYRRVTSELCDLSDIFQTIFGAAQTQPEAKNEGIPDFSAWHRTKNSLSNPKDVKRGHTQIGNDAG